MKRFVLACGLVFLSPWMAKGAVEVARFERYYTVDGALEIGTHGRLRVPDEVFDTASVFPAGLRLVGDDGTEWPFYAWVPAARAIRRVPVQILNLSRVDATAPFVQFDVVIPPLAGAAVVHKRLALRTSGHNYLRRVEVFSTTSPDSHGQLATGWLIQTSRPQTVKNQIVQYPASDATRLHVRIYTDATSGTDSFEILGAEVLLDDGAPRPPLEEVTFEQLPVPRGEVIDGAQTFLLDLGMEGRPVEEIGFEVADPSFVRSVVVHGRNRAQDPWQRVGRGEIHALEGDNTDSVELCAQNRFLKVQLYHYDDAPLSLSAIRLKARSRWLVFEAATAGRARLYFGGRNIATPRYDLQRRMEGVDPLSLPVFTTASARDNPAFRPASFRTVTRGWAATAVGGVSVLVLWVIVRMMRQRFPLDADATDE